MSHIPKHLGATNLLQTIIFKVLNMKKIYFIFAICSCFFIYPGKAQDIKQYSGSFNDGTASYSYYEREDGSRAMHGKFTAKKDVGTTYNSKYSYSILGYYVNDKRDGEWVIDFTNVTNKESFSGKLCINYKNGLHQGPFIVDIKAKDPVKIESPYNDAINAANNCYFKFDCRDNNAVGPVEIILNDLVYKGQATDGIMSGKWIISDNCFHRTYDFTSGKGITIDVETGDRFDLERFPRYKELLGFLIKYVGFYESLTDPGNRMSSPNPKKYTEVRLLID